MNAFDDEMVRTWETQVRVSDEVLAEIAAGRTKRAYSAVEIEDIKIERARFLALIAGYKASLTA